MNEDHLHPKDRDELTNLNRAWLASYVARDIETLGGILANDFLSIYSGGGTQSNRDQTLAKLAAMTDEPLSIAVENFTMHVAGDTAIVSARATTTLRGNSGDYEEKNDYADIYARRNGHWQAVSAFIVPIPSTTSG